MKQKQIIITLLLITTLLLSGSNSLAANQFHSDIDPDINLYYDIIEKINNEYHLDFAIDDPISFTEHIVNKMTPKEFEDMLIADSKDFSKPEHIVESTITLENDKLLRHSILYPRKIVTITSGNKIGQLWASFEVIDLTTYRYFKTFTGAGNIRSTSTWFFDTMLVQAMSVTTSKASIYYNGRWVYGPTGLSQNVVTNYTFTFYP